jgi:hypothetical protein
MLEFADDQPKERRLAIRIFADDARDLAGPQLEIDTFKDETRRVEAAAQASALEYDLIIRNLCAKALIHSLHRLFACDVGGGRLVRIADDLADERQHVLLELLLA